MVDQDGRRTLCTTCIMCTCMVHMWYTPVCIYIYIYIIYTSRVIASGALPFLLDSSSRYDGQGSSPVLRRLMHACLTSYVLWLRWLCGCGWIFICLGSQDVVTAQSWSVTGRQVRHRWPMAINMAVPSLACALSSDLMDPR